MNKYEHAQLIFAEKLPREALSRDSLRSVAVAAIAAAQAFDDAWEEYRSENPPPRPPPTSMPGEPGRRT